MYKFIQNCSIANTKIVVSPKTIEQKQKSFWSLLMIISLLLPISNNNPVYAQTNTISGHVFVDHDGGGTEDGVDYGHPAIRVKAYCDVDGDGAVDPTIDKIAGIGFTDENGDYTIEVNHTPNTTVSVPVSVSTDDSDESRLSGVVDRYGLLEPGNDDVGIRFNRVEIPACATVTSAYIEFVTPNGGNVNYNFEVEADIDPSTYNIRLANDITNRNYSGSVNWNATLLGGSTVQSPDLSSLVNTAISQVGWQPYNAIAFQVSGSGSANFYSYDDYLSNGQAASAIPTLHITYSMPSPPHAYIIRLCTEDLDPSSTVTLNNDQIISATDVAAGVNLSNVDYGFKGPPVFCYTVADNGNSGNPDEFVVYNRLTGTSRVVGSTGTFDIEALSISYDSNIQDYVIYTVNGDQFGTLDPNTGAFSALGGAMGSINGAYGSYDIADVDGIAFDIDGSLWASERVSGGYDILFKIDPATGQPIPNVFGAGVDYVVMRDSASSLPDDIDDIVIDPTTGKMYAIANKSTAAGGGTPIVDYDVLVEVNKQTGELTNIGIVTLDGQDLNDIEGFTFTSSGIFLATTGKDSKISTDQNQLSFQIDIGTATARNEVYVGAASDYETCDCLAGAANELCGRIFVDSNCDEDYANELLLQGIELVIFLDVNQNGIRDIPEDMPVDTLVTDANGYYSWQTPYNVPYSFIVGIVGTPAEGLYVNGEETDAMPVVDFSSGFGGLKDTTNFNYCPTQPEFRIGKTVNIDSVAVGDTVVFTIDLDNFGGTNPDLLQVIDSLPAGLTYVETSDPTNTIYDSTNHAVIWNVGTFPEGDPTKTLTITAVVEQPGVFVNSVHVPYADVDETNNSDKACVSAPFGLPCDGSTITATAPAGHATYQWYKDGVPIAGATSQSYVIDDVGSYQFTVDDAELGTCSGQLCCPIHIVEIPCCPPTFCIPITVTKKL